jgi:hypothetical protein
MRRNPKEGKKICQNQQGLLKTPKKETPKERERTQRQAKHKT